MVTNGVYVPAWRESFRENEWVIFRAPAVLPIDWEQGLLDAVRQYGADVLQKGRGPGSLESDETAGLDYRVLTTDAVIQYAPWLWDFYTSQSLRQVVEDVVGRPVETRDGPDALNVNFMQGQRRYEWHNDPDPYTLLLYATPTSPAIGGGLMLKVRNKAGTIYPQPGDCILFDGSRIPHAVEQLRSSDAQRVSAPMVFFPTGHIAAHDSATSAYLYGAS